MLHKLARAAHTRLTNAWPVRQCRSRLTAPVATITFDDFPHSAWTAGGAVLQEHGVRGTYFVSAAFAPENLARRTPHGPIDGVQYYELDDVVQAHAQGHEIGCHSFDHRTAPGLSATELDASFRSNAEFVRNLLGDVVMTSFAFPQGQADVRTKRLASRYFPACRGTWPGVNSGIVDLSLLRCVNLEPRTLARFPLTKLIEQAQADNGWLILTTHDVTDMPSEWGCTPAQLRGAVELLLRSGFEILPLKNALGRVAFA